MTNLLEFREWLKNFYAKFSIYILAGIRFIVTLVSASLINHTIGYFDRLKTPAIPLILAMFAAFLPLNVTVVFAACLILLHLYSVSLELMAIVFVLFLIILLVYYRFTPKYAFVLFLTPVAFALKVPVLIPLIIGIAATPTAIVPVGFGTVIYFLLNTISQSSSALLRTGEENSAQAYLYVMKNTIGNPELYLSLVAMAVTILLVYMIRRLKVDHSWSIALVSGTLCHILFFLIGDFVLDISSNALILIISSVISLLITFVLQFFLFSVDYSRTEYVQFEDDEYYYYVKAIPKIKITKRDKKIKRINAQSSPPKKIREERRRSGVRVEE